MYFGLGPGLVFMSDVWVARRQCRNISEHLLSTLAWFREITLMDLYIGTKVDPSWGDEQLRSVFVNLCAYMYKL